MPDKVVVVIPIYKVETYLRECVDSVVKQTCHNISPILVDDGSPDGCGSICDEYAFSYDNLIVIHKVNGGLSAARNTGLDFSNGKYIYFLDSDDYIAENAIEKLRMKAEEEKADMVFFNAVNFDNESGHTFKSAYVRKHSYSSLNGREQFDKLFTNQEYWTPVPFIFWKSNYIKKKVNIRFPEGLLHEDVLFTFEAFMGNGLTVQCQDTLYYRRIHSDSIMTSKVTCANFKSMLEIYYHISEKYSAMQGAALKYIVLCAKAVLNKYAGMSKEEQQRCENELKNFKEYVRRHKGYGDVKLLQKCSGSIAAKYIKLKHRIMTYAK